MVNETVSAIEILRDYDREMTVKTRAMLADEIERLNDRLGLALYRLEQERSDNAKLRARNFLLRERLEQAGGDCD